MIKLIKILFTVVFFISQSLIYGESFFRAPEYCSSYDEIHSLNDAASEAGNEQVYSSCLAGHFVEVEVKDIVNHWSDIEGEVVNQSNKSTSKEILSVMFDKLQERVGKFEGLAGGQKEQLSEGMMSCLQESFPEQAKKIKEKREQKIVENKESTNIYLNSSFDKAVLLNALMDEVQRRTKVFDNALLMTNMRMTADLKIKGSSAKSNKYTRMIDEINKAKESFLNEFNGELKALSINSPLLVDSVSDFQLNDMYKSKLVKSKLGKKLVGNLPSELDKRIKEAFRKGKQGDGFNLKVNRGERSTDQDFEKAMRDAITEKPLKEGLSDYFAVLKDEARDMAEHKANQLNDKKEEIDVLLKNSAQAYSEGIYNSIEDNCNDQGEYIHYNNDVVGLMGGSIYEDAKMSLEEKKRRLINLQQWQCRQWREHPPTEMNKMTFKRKAGDVLILSGMLVGISSAATGAGSIVGSAMVAGGLALGTMGGSLYLYENVKDRNAFAKEVKELESAYYMGWQDVHTLQTEGYSILQKLDNKIAMDAAAATGGSLNTFKAIRRVKSIAAARNSLSIKNLVSVLKINNKASAEQIKIAEDKVKQLVAEFSKRRRGRINFIKNNSDEEEILNNLRYIYDRISSNSKFKIFPADFREAFDNAKDIKNVSDMVGKVKATYYE